jgi:hypothetical protein
MSPAIFREHIRTRRDATNLEKANRKGAKAQRLAKTMHYKEPAILPSGESPVSGFPLRYLASLRLCGYELQFLG